MNILGKRLVIAIQARLSSSRFPGKVLKPFLGKTVIDTLVANLRLTSIPVYVLTSDDESDLPLAEHLENTMTPYYRGSLLSPANRYLSFMNEFEFEYVIRISGDSPLLHPENVLRCVNEVKENHLYDLITNVYPRTFPSGQSVEFIPKKTLTKLLNLNLSANDHEHVTSFIYSNYMKFHIANLVNPSPTLLPKMSLDYPHELSSLNNLGQFMIDNGLFGVSWYEAANKIHSSGKFT